MEVEVADLIKKGLVSVTHLHKGEHKKFLGPKTLNFSATAQVRHILRLSSLDALCKTQHCS